MLAGGLFHLVEGAGELLAVRFLWRRHPWGHPTPRAHQRGGPEAASVVVQAFAGGALGPGLQPRWAWPLRPVSSNLSLSHQVAIDRCCPQPLYASPFYGIVILVDILYLPTPLLYSPNRPAGKLSPSSVPVHFSPCNFPNLLPGKLPPPLYSPSCNVGKLSPHPVYRPSCHLTTYGGGEVLSSLSTCFDDSRIPCM